MLSLRAVLPLVWAAVMGISLAGAAAEPDPPEKGFEAIFDGRSLAGWRASDARYWSVQDEAITGSITLERPLGKNLYLVWEGGTLRDFELKLEHRVFGSAGINCGFQFRSRELPDHDVAGYQVDNNLDTPWLVRLYDEHGRHTLAMRGQRTTCQGDGKLHSQEIADAAGEPWFQLDKWHAYHLVCCGERLTLYVDGRLACEVIDRDPRERDLEGILALQLHSGPPTTAQFRNIRLKTLESPPPPR